MKALTDLKYALVLLLVIIVMKIKGQNNSWEYLEPLPAPRSLSAAAVLDGKIYVLGGVGNESSVALTSVLKYDIKTDQWDTSVTDLPVPLARATASALNGKLYVVGGMGYDNWGWPLRSVYEYDPELNSWTRKADMNKSRHGHRTVLLDGNMIVMGGVRLLRLGYSPVEYASVEMYLPETDSWIFLSSMHADRLAFTAQVVNGKIYVFGGSDDRLFDGGFYGRVFPISQAEVYEPQLDHVPLCSSPAACGNWTKLENLSRPICAGGSAVVDNHIYHFGGLAVDTFGLPTTGIVPSPGMSMWDPIETTWIDMGIQMADTVMEFAYAQTINETGEDCIYVFGGTPFSYWRAEYRGAYGSRDYSDAVQRYCFSATSTPMEEIGEINEELYKIYPNPINTSATIQYTLKENSSVRIKIFDVSGHEIGTLLDTVQPQENEKLIGMWRIYRLRYIIVPYRRRIILKLKNVLCCTSFFI